MARELKVKVGLDNAAFFAGLKGVQGALGGAARNITRIALRAGAALAAIGAPLTVGAFAAGIKNALDYGGAISDAAARTGIAAGQLVVLQQAFKDGGLSAEQAGQSINKMQRSIFEAGQATTATDEYLEGFKALGLEVQDLLGLQPAEQFDKISKAIAATEDPTTRTAAAMKIFGRSGAELQTLFRNPEALAKAAQRVGSQADILAKQADRFDDVSDSFNSLGVKLRGFFVGVADKLLPELERLAAWFDGLDLASIGQRAGESIRSVVRAIEGAVKQGRLSELISLSITAGGAVGLNYLAAGMVTLGRLLTAAIKGAFGAETARLAAASFFANIAAAILKLASLLKAAFVAVAKLVANVIANALFEGLPERVRGFLAQRGLSPTKPDRAPDFAELFSQEFDTTGTTVLADAIERQVAEGFANAREVAAEELAAAAREIGRILRESKADDIFGSADKIAQLRALIAELGAASEALNTSAAKAGGGLGDIAETFGRAVRGPDVDQFARVGLFTGQGGVGSQATRALDFARRTAEGIQRIRDTMASGLKVTMAGAVEVKV